MTNFFTYDKIKYDHLINLPFVHGEQDCYTLAQKIMADNTPIRLSNYARPESWWLTDENLYVNNFENEGYRMIDHARLVELQPLDAFLISVPDGSDLKKFVTNHCAIYVGDGMIVHHRLGTLSSCVPYRGWLKDLTTHVLRHKDVPKMTGPDVKIDIMERILPHKRDRLLKALNAKQSAEN